MKILMSAYACEPGLGSEEDLGWNTARETASSHEVWVLTRTFSRSAIEVELLHNPVPNLHFVYFEPLGWSEDWKGKQGLVQLHYYLWQIQAYFVAKTLHKTQEFNFTWHSTYAKYWGPSFLSLLAIPFIWGPVGGGETAPIDFWKDFSLRGKLYEALRILAQRIGEQDPFTKMTAQRSFLAFATSEETAERLRHLKAKNVHILSSVGLSETDIKQLANCLQPADNVIRFVSIGRLLHWKGFHLGLRAFAAAQIPNSEYWFFGDGPERKRLESLAEKLQVAQKVKFWGAVPRKEILSKLEKCHVLVHPSLHDSGGWVCSEMMAAGRPVICLDLGGPSVQITKETGIKVPAHNPEQAVNGLMAAMIQLASDSDLRTQMGQAGQRRVREHFSWKVKGQYFSNLYEKILIKSKCSTNF